MAHHERSIPPPGLPQPPALGLGLSTPAAPPLAAREALAGRRRGGAGLRRAAPRASTSWPWPRASRSSAPTGPPTGTTTSAGWSRTTSAPSGGAGRWSAGSTRRCSPLTATASATDQVVVYDCMDELANFAGARPVSSRPRVGSSGGPTSSSPAAGASSSRSSDRHPNVHCFPSAVDAAHFARALDPELGHPGGPRGLAPADLRLLRRGGRAARLRPDRRAGRHAGGRLDRAGRAGDQGRSGRLAESPEPALPRPAGLLRAAGVPEGIRRLPDALGAERGDEDDQPDQDAGIHGRRASRSSRRPCATWSATTATSSAIADDPDAFVRLALGAIADHDGDPRPRHAPARRRQRLGRRRRRHAALRRVRSRDRAASPRGRRKAGARRATPRT